MLKNRNRRRPMAEINVVPYIDVMLVLLVIFMMTAPLLTQGVNVNLPKVSAQTINQNLEEPLIISVDANGDYFLNVTSTQNEKIAPTELGKRVESQLAIEKTKHLNPTVLVKGDKNVNYGKIIEAMVLLQQAGIAQVGLITEPPSQNA